MGDPHVPPFTGREAFPREAEHHRSGQHGIVGITRVSSPIRPVMDDLKAYENGGIKILICGICLNYFNVLKRKQVSETTNISDILTAMQLPDKVITI